MANRFMTGTTCGNSEIIEFVGQDDNAILNKFYQISDGRCIELTATGSTTTQHLTNWFSYGPFDSCDECLAPFSGSTGGNNGVVCEVCSGSTFTVDPLKPEYTNKFGKTVQQINAVVIGGNGLNS